MRLRIARKVIAATRRLLLVKWGAPHPGQHQARHRAITMERAYDRIRPIHRRHFPAPVLRPLSHRKRERP